MNLLFAKSYYSVLQEFNVNTNYDDTLDQQRVFSYCFVINDSNRTTLNIRSSLNFTIQSLSENNLRTSHVLGCMYRTLKL